MDFTLRSGLHHREVDGARIFFDLPADRYFLLAGPIADCFERFISSAGTDADCAELAGTKLIQKRISGEPNPDRVIVAPTRSLIDQPQAAASLSGTWGALWRLRRARAALRHTPLVRLVGEIQGAGRPDLATDMDLCARVAADFQRAGRYTSTKDQCLVRGIAMTHALADHGTRASLVFGVTMPFAAHCWVQAGDTVLTDPLDIVLHYQPIYVV